MTINCKGNLVDLSSPKVMGILNYTPDSFYDGGRFNNEAELLKQVEKMLGEGASFIDLGAYSSRPGAKAISEEEELRRILPAVQSLIRSFPEILLSVDTFRASVASECLDSGAALINDISAGQADEAMIPLVAKRRIPYIIMHMKGTPQNMQKQTDYEDLTGELLYYFSERVALARSEGIQDLIIDPGFGFAKDRDQNYELLKDLHVFRTLGLPILVGLSRKSMIYNTLDIKAEEALNGTTALHMFALTQGANILRAHDVKEAMECIQLFEKIS